MAKRKEKREEETTETEQMKRSKCRRAGTVHSRETGKRRRDSGTLTRQSWATKKKREKSEAE